LDDLHHPEASLFEGPQRYEIAFLRIGNDGANGGVYKHAMLCELADRNRTQPQACHLDFPNCEVDASRKGCRF